MAAKIGSGSSPQTASTPPGGVPSVAQSNQDTSPGSGKPACSAQKETKSSEAESQSKKKPAITGAREDDIVESEIKKQAVMACTAGDACGKTLGVNIPDDSFLPAVVRDHSSPVERYLGTTGGRLAMAELFLQEEDQDGKNIPTKDHTQNSTANVDEKSQPVNKACEVKDKPVKDVIGDAKDDYLMPKFIELSQLGIMNENYTNSIRSDDIDWEAVALYEEHVRKIDEPIKIGHNSVCYALSNVEVFHRNSACGMYFDQPGEKQKPQVLDTLVEVDKTLDVLQGVCEPACKNEAYKGAQQTGLDQNEQTEGDKVNDAQPKKPEPKAEDIYEQVKHEEKQDKPETKDKDMSVKTAKQPECEKPVSAIQTVPPTDPSSLSAIAEKPPVQKKSPSSRFSLLSFFDRILLPHDKSSNNNKSAQAEKAAATKDETVTSPNTSTTPSTTSTSPSSTATSASAVSPISALTSGSPSPIVSPKAKESAVNDSKAEKTSTPKKKSAASKRSDSKSPARGKSSSRESTPVGSRKSSKQSKESTPTRRSRESTPTKKDSKAVNLDDVSSPNSNAGASTAATTSASVPAKKPSKIRSLFFKSKAPPNPDKDRIIQEEKISPPTVTSCKIITTAGAVRNKSAEMFGKARPLSAIVDREFPHNFEDSCEFGSPDARTASTRPLSLYDRPYSDIFYDRYVPGEFLSELRGGAGLIGSAPSPVGHAPFLPEGKSGGLFGGEDATLGHRSASSPALDSTPTLSCGGQLVAEAAREKEPRLSGVNSSGVVATETTSLSESGSSASIGEVRRAELRQSCEWDDGMSATDLRYILSLSLPLSLCFCLSVSFSHSLKYSLSIGLFV